MNGRTELRMRYVIFYLCSTHADGNQHMAPSFRPQKRAIVCNRNEYQENSDGTPRDDSGSLKSPSRSAHHCRSARDTVAAVFPRRAVTSLQRPAAASLPLAAIPVTSVPFTAVAAGAPAMLRIRLLLPLREMLLLPLRVLLLYRCESRCNHLLASRYCNSWACFFCQRLCCASVALLRITICRYQLLDQRKPLARVLPHT